jgi:hypothetical protein
MADISARGINVGGHVTFVDSPMRTGVDAHFDQGGRFRVRGTEEVRDVPPVIRLDYKMQGGKDTVLHEYGHYVDWRLGGSNQDPTKHEELWSDKTFKQFGLTGNRHELVADMFLQHVKHGTTTGLKVGGLDVKHVEAFHKHFADAMKSLRTAASSKSKLPVHTVADSAVPLVRKAFLNSLPDTWDEASIELWGARLREKLTGILHRVVVASGQVHGMKLRVAGDVDGHPFHGNQYTDGEGGGGAEKIFVKKHLVETGRADAEALAAEFRQSGSKTAIVPVRGKSGSFHVHEIRGGGAMRGAESLRSLKPPQRPKTGMKFDASNPAAIKWARDHSAQLVTNITDDAKKAIQYLTARVESGDMQVRDMKKMLKSFVGLTQKQGEALVALRDSLDEQGLSASEIEDEIDAKSEEMLDRRAETISRTETMSAANEGQQELWEQGVDDGQLTGDELKEWLVTPDDRLCELCMAMENVQVGLDEDFDFDGEAVSTPPGHPQCRCTVGLAMPRTLGGAGSGNFGHSGPHPRDAAVEECVTGGAK